MFGTKQMWVQNDSPSPYIYIHTGDSHKRKKYTKYEIIRKKERINEGESNVYSEGTEKNYSCMQKVAHLSPWQVCEIGHSYILQK